MSKQGSSFHRLVHAIESAVAGKDQLKIEAPKRLRDKDTGKMREHDLVLTFRQQHHELLVAIECRDRSRPIGVPDIEAFHAKCLRTGIDRGIMVSSIGFTATALKKAKSTNIGCMTLDEVEKFQWCLTPGAHVTRRDIVALKCELLFAELPPDERIIRLDDETPASPELQGIWANQAFSDYFFSDREGFDRRFLKDGSGEVTLSFTEDNPPLHTFAEDGRRLPAMRLTLTATYSLRRDFVPFEFRQYFDLAKSNVITDMAVAPLPLQAAGGPANLVMNKQAGGRIQVSVVPIPEKLRG